jgi:hypothetical protein
VLIVNQVLYFSAFYFDETDTRNAQPSETSARALEASASDAPYNVLRKSAFEYSSNKVPIRKIDLVAIN